MAYDDHQGLQPKNLGLGQRRSAGPRGPVFPRLDLARIVPHLPHPQRIRIEINGCLCGAPVAIPDAVSEFAIGWAFANRFFDRVDQVSKVSATAPRSR